MVSPALLLRQLCGTSLELDWTVARPMCCKGLCRCRVDSRMAQIRLLEIKNFRSIKDLAWQPAAGINCLIGPGDSGKSTILDAIDLCLGARRTVQFTDADFSELNVQSPIEITITLGDLSDRLKTLDSYGLFLRGFNADTKQLEDEPETGLETAMCIKLCVSEDTSHLRH